MDRPQMGVCNPFNQNPTGKINLLVDDQAGQLRNNLPSRGCCPSLAISLDEVVDKVPIAKASARTCPANC